VRSLRPLRLTLLDLGMESIPKQDMSGDAGTAERSPFDNHRRSKGEQGDAFEGHRGPVFPASLNDYISRKALLDVSRSGPYDCTSAVPIF